MKRWIDKRTPIEESALAPTILPKQIILGGNNRHPPFRLLPPAIALQFYGRGVCSFKVIPSTLYLEI